MRLALLGLSALMAVAALLSANAAMGPQLGEVPGGKIAHLAYD